MTESGVQSSSRKTALVVGAMLSALAAWNFHRGRVPVAVTLGAIAVVLTGVGLFLPSWALRFHHAWMNVASVLGFVQSLILLSIVYYGVVTPLGFIIKMIGRDDLGRRGPKKSSYWVRCEASRQTKDGFEKSF